MTSAYALLIHSIEGVPRQPSGPFGRRKGSSNIYISVHQDGAEVHRTPKKRDSEAPWDFIYTLSPETESTKISFRLMRESFLPGTDTCLGTADTDFGTLLGMCSSVDESTYARLEMKTASRRPQTNSRIILSVHLTPQVNASAKAINVAKVSSKRLQSSLSSLTAKLDVLLRLGDTISESHPYVSISWKVLSAVYQAAKRQQDADEKLLKLVDTMVDVYSIVQDTDFLADKLKSLENTALAIAKQTVECAYFIQEYMACGFASRTLRTMWSETDKRIDVLIETLVNLRNSFQGRMVVQSLFMSTKMLQKIENLDQSDTLRKLNPVDMNASGRTSCLPGTRGDVLDDIRHWASVPDNDSNNLFWLSGVAGSGKSTIATTVAESFRSLERLGAFLFFDRNNQVQSHPDGVIRTLAYCLAQTNPHIAAAICTAIQRDPAVVNAPIRTQFQCLLLEPLQATQSCVEGPILVVLDALDECGDPASRAGLLFVLSTELPRIPRNFRFFITSRAEKDISDQFQRLSARMQLDVSSATPDIMRFITHEMELIRAREGDDLSPSWPGALNIQRLVELSGGLFIWASTATAFLAEYDPETRLQTLLTHHFIPGSNLDGLYSVALRGSGPWDSDAQFAADARAVLACVVLGRVPMSDQTMDAIVSPSRRSAARVLKHLRCVVQWNGSGSEARTIHLSFADYLTDSTRSGREPWAIDGRAQQATLALGCLRVLSRELRFNICGLEDSHLPNVEVPDLAVRIGRCISTQLRYSSSFWASHLQEALFDDLVLDELRVFFNSGFLHWLEVLSLLGEVSRASDALRLASQYTEGRAEDLENVIADAIKFESAFAPLITQSAPHIYVSALAFTPHKSIIAERFAGQFPHKLTYSGPLGANWPSLQKVLRGHTDWISSICFSSDGVRIVSGSADGAVCVWDARTGECLLQTILVRGATKSPIRGVKFTPDDSRIISASEAEITIWNAVTGELLLDLPSEDINTMDIAADGTRVAVGTHSGMIHVRDAGTGESVASWQAHKDVINTVHFSPTSTCLVSASADGSASIWNSETGVRLVGPLVHSYQVSCVQFSPDGSQVATSCWDAIVRIWDANTGHHIPAFDKSSDLLTLMIKFSSDGTRIAGGSFFGAISLWDVASGQDINGQREGHIHAVTSICFSPDGSRLASAASHTIRIWDAQGEPHSSEMAHNLKHNESPTFLDFSGDGMRVAYGTFNGMLLIRDTERGTILAGPVAVTPPGPAAVTSAGQVFSVQFSPKGDLITAAFFDHTVRVYETSALVEVAIMRHNHPIRATYFSEDATQITTLTSGGEIHLWDVHGGNLLPQPTITEWPRGKTVGLKSAGRFSRCGAVVACGCGDRVLRIWDSRTGVLITEIESGPVDCLDFSPDATQIATGWGGSCHVSIWDTRTGRLLRESNIQRAISAVQFSPDGLCLAVGSPSYKVLVLETETMHLLSGVLNGHTASVCCLRWFPDGTQVASGSWDKTIRFWDVRPSFESNTALQAHLGDSPIFKLTGDMHGWVLNGASQRMFWVPPWLREGLYFSRSSLVIRDRGTTKLDLSQFVHGVEWVACFQGVE
ncbi:quinon protein alcohol dehydrogenase-like superfamily [Roridomyces roridus]|uniref:Quinon protein alcohol dehydrogenase-like superfamily n=1 Tax=Roridomyces roridus TaxID=1738132 RepID=A0AAD7B8H2_9AGAR|nr:quinon protein alcohol dehydrogenase-like superfamily [Roridomyces roridus]